MPPHPLTNFETQKYYQNEPKFSGIYSRNNLANIKDGAYVTNVEEFKSIGTHCIVLYANGNNVTYFHRFGVEHISKEIKKFVGNKNIITNIYRTPQAYDSIMCGYFCTGFIDFILKGKSFLDYRNLVSPNKNERNDKIVLKYFQ